MSEASMYQAIRRHWKREYNDAQRMQTWVRQAHELNLYPYVYHTLDHLRLKKAVRFEEVAITVFNAQAEYLSYQSKASHMAFLLNQFKMKPKKAKKSVNVSWE